MRKPIKTSPSPITIREEKELIILAKAGDLEAFGKIVECNLERIYSLAYSLSRNQYETEEIVQEVFLKALKGIGNFRSESGIGTWLYRITINTYLNIKKIMAYFPLEQCLENQKPISGSKLKTDESINDLKKSIDKNLAKLSERERTVFVLKHYEDIPIKEIASMLGISYGTVRTLLFRAVRKLRYELSDLQASRTINRRKE